MTLVSGHQITKKGFSILLHDKGLCVYKTIDDVRRDNPFLSTDKQITEKLWTVPIKSVSPYKGTTPKQTSKSTKSLAAMVDGATSQWSVQTYHEASDHRNLHDLKLIWPHLENVRDLPICDACLSQSLRKPYSKMGHKKKKKDEDERKSVKYDFIPFKNQLPFSKTDEIVDISDSLTHPTADDPPIEENQSKENLGNPSDRKEVSISDAHLLKVDNPVWGDTNVDVQTIDLGAHAEAVNSELRFGRYLNSDTKYVDVESVRGYRYLYLVIDKDTRVTFAFLGVLKSDFTPIIQRWLRKFHNIYGRYPEHWKFDQGGEFLNDKLREMLEKKGTTFIFSTTQAHNQNAYSERKICVVWNSVMKMLAGSGVPMQFWCYCATYAVFVQNHMPHRGLDCGIPLKHARMRTTYQHLYPFGCEVWFVDEKGSSSKSRCKRGVFLGVSPFKQGYEILDIESRQVITSRNVEFNPTRKPFLIAQQPCKIQLDFGTWPSPHAMERVSLPEVPSTVLIHPEYEERGGSHIVDVPSVPRTHAPQNDLQPVHSSKVDPSNVELKDSDQNIGQPPTQVPALPSIPEEPGPLPSTESAIDTSSIPTSTTDATPTQPSTMETPLSPITGITPKGLASDWEPDTFQVSPEVEPRPPVFPTRDVVPDYDFDLDEKHNLVPSETDVGNGDTGVDTTNGDTTTDGADGKSTVNTMGSKNIVNPMSKLISTTTPGEGPIDPGLLEDTIEGDEAQPVKGSLKSLNLNPDRKKGRGRPRKYLVDIGSGHRPVRFETDREPTADDYWEVEEILGRKEVPGTRTDKYEYLVKWKDYKGISYPDAEWVPAKNLHAGTRRAYDKAHHPKPKKQPKVSGTNTVPHTKRSTTSSMTLRKRNVPNMNEGLLSRKTTERPNGYDYFGRIPPSSSHGDRQSAESVFHTWTKPMERDKSPVDAMTPIDPIERSLHYAYDTIAEINSTIHHDRDTDREKIRVNDTVSITDITDEEMEKSKLALLALKLEAKESIYVDPSAYEEVLLAKDTVNTSFKAPAEAEIAGSASHQTFSVKDYDGQQPEPHPSDRVQYIHREEIQLPPHRVVKPVLNDDITLEEMVQQSELNFEGWTKKVIAEREECYRVKTTGEVSKEELTMERAENQKEAYESEFRDEYIEAEHRELKGLALHGTFEETYCPPNRTPITCRWAYDLKRDKDGRINLFKARLVVHGFKQVEGIDFNKTFSSTAQLRTFRFVVAIAVAKGYSMTQYDISQAFLNGTLEEELYMNFPPGYPSENKGTVLKLLKGLYGLKQASRIWQKTLYKALKDLGMDPCKTESGVLRWPGQDKMVLVVCWVDDLIIVCDDEKLRKKIEEKLAKEFLTKMLGELDIYVGIVLERDRKGHCDLHQTPFIKKVVAKFPVLRKFHANVPAQSDRLSKSDCPLSSNDVPDYPYMSVTGSLLYAAICTRPDIFYAVMQLARFNSNPGKAHVRASEQCLRYLEETPDLGIRFTAPKNKSAKIRIEAFVDSDWGGCPDTRRSTTGYVIHVCGGPVAWRSKLMQTIALSSCEAEFMALTEVCRELMWMCRFLDEIGIEYETPNVYCDSSSAINWAEDPVQHQRNKHVEIKYYYCRDVVADEKVRLFKINTVNNLADIMTKPVGQQIIKRLRERVMGHGPPVFDDA